EDDDLAFVVCEVDGLPVGVRDSEAGGRLADLGRPDWGVTKHQYGCAADCESGDGFQFHSGSSCSVSVIVVDCDGPVVQYDHKDPFWFLDLSLGVVRGLGLNDEL